MSSGAPHEADRPAFITAPSSLPPWRAWAGALLVAGIATGLAALLEAGGLELTEIAMGYLLGIVFVAGRWGQGPAVVTSLLSVALFDFWFVPPRFDFAVTDVRHLLTFVVMFVVGIVVSTLTVRVRNAAIGAARREQRMTALYSLGRDLSRTRKRNDIAAAVARHVEGALEGKVLVLLPDGAGALVPLAGTGTLAAFDSHELGIARSVHESGKPAGFATEAAPGGLGTYLPLRAGPIRHGVLGILAADERLLRDPEQWRMLEAASDLAALALERVRLAKEAHVADVRARSEELRNALLASVSHDLRTPLAAITGASSVLLDESLPAGSRRELLQAVRDEMERLNRRVGNLLDMVRLQGGNLALRLQWSSIEEIVGAALRRLAHRLGGRSVTTAYATQLPLVRVDETMLETVVVNLVENTLKYAPPDSPVEIEGAATNEFVVLRVSDRGPGLPPGAEERIFEKFYRADNAGAREGVGLGLAICRAIVDGHGGGITARNREGGGAVFEVSLPREPAPPRPPPEDEA